MLLQLVELACNQAFEHDPESLARIQALSGKVVVLEIRDLNQSISIHPQQFGIELIAGAVEAPAVTLSATPPALFKIVRHGMDNADLEPGELEIQGDPIVAQKFAAIASGLNVDWDALLAEHFGEIPASLISQGASIVKTVIDDGRQVVKDQVNNVLLNDLDLVAGAQKVESYLEGVDDLRAVVDRLESRLNRILNHESH